MKKQSFAKFFAVLGVILAPFTKLRVGAIGFSEVFFLFSLFFSNPIVDANNLKARILFKQAFSCLFICFSLGTIWNLFFLHNIHEGVLHTFFALFFNALLTIKLWPSFNYKDLISILKLSIIIIILIHAAMFFSHSSYFYYGKTRFTGLSLNPNQLAVTFLIIPIFIFYFMACEGNSFKKYSWLLFLSLSLFLGWLIRSQALWVAWSVTTCIFLYFLLWSRKKNSFLVRALLVLFSLYLIGTLIFMAGYLYTHLDYYTAFFFGDLGDKESAVRYKLWWLGIKETFFYSPIFGHGFGSFINLDAGDLSRNSEAHNTFVDVFIQSGLLGLAVFLAFFIKIISVSFKKNNLYGLTAITSLAFFVCFHYMLRQPFFWLILYWSFISSFYTDKNKLCAV